MILTLVRAKDTSTQQLIYSNSTQGALKVSNIHSSNYIYTNINVYRVFKIKFSNIFLSNPTMKAESQPTFKSEFQYFIKIAYLTTVNQYLNFVPHPTSPQIRSTTQ